MIMTTEETRRLVAEIPLDLWGEADKIRKREGMTWVGLITKLLRQWVEENK